MKLGIIMNNENIAKKIFYVVSASIFILLLVGYGIIIEKYKIFPYDFIVYVDNTVHLVYDERFNIAKIEPQHFLHPARHEGDGVTKNLIPPSQKDLVLLGGFIKDTNEFRLIRRDGSIVARWPVKFSKYFPNPSFIKFPPETDWNVDVHGGVLNPDGSLVFTFNYGGLVKLDHCGKLIWALARPTSHSVEHAEGGGYWVTSRKYYSEADSSPFPPYDPPFNTDTVLKVSENGKILTEISAVGLFYENGEEALLTSGNHSFEKGSDGDNEIVHLNKIEELKSNLSKYFPMFDVGDLLLSFRYRHLLLVLNPTNHIIKWFQMGPWLRQHDPSFAKNRKIILFNNNAFINTVFPPANSENQKTNANKNQFNKQNHAHDKSGNILNTIPGRANIMEFDPKTKHYKIIYGMKDGQEMYSRLRGTVKYTPRGNIIITEAESGRILEIDKKGNIVWEYINRYDSNRVSILTESRVYPEDYFHLSNWSCR